MQYFEKKKSEMIQITPDIALVVVAITPEKVRLGIIAPREIPIWRKELIDQGIVKSDAPKFAARTRRRMDD